MKTLWDTLNLHAVKVVLLVAMVRWAGGARRQAGASSIGLLLPNEPGVARRRGTAPPRQRRGLCARLAACSLV